MITSSDAIVFMLVLTRVSTFIVFFPLFSKRQLPSLVKVGLAASFSMFWFGDAQATLAGTNFNAIGTFGAVLMLVKEATIGIALATCLGIFFWPARIAGAYVGQELGLSLASINDPGSQDSSTLVSRIFESFTTLLFFMMNLHHFVIMSIHFSFTRVFAPAGITKFPTEQITSSLTGVVDLGLVMIAPLVVIFMAVTLTLAFLNKATPTLNLFSVGMSIRAGLGVFCVMLFWPAIVGALQACFYHIQADVEEILGLLV